VSNDTIRAALVAYSELAEHMLNEVCHSYAEDAELAAKALRLLDEQAQPQVPESVKLQYQAEAVRDFALVVWDEIQDYYEYPSVFPLSMAEIWVEKRAALFSARQNQGDISVE
jgi:hypothetical protein